MFPLPGGVRAGAVPVAPAEPQTPEPEQPLEPTEWTAQLPHAHVIAKQVIQNIVNEYGDEVFISDGYAPGADLAVAISHAICDAYMGGLAVRQEQADARPARDWNPKETLFAFMGWLTIRRERVTLSSTDDAGIACDLIEQFSKRHGLAEPRDGWENAIVPESGGAPHGQ